MNERGGERTRTICCGKENKSKMETNSCKTGGSSPNTERKGPCPPSGEIWVLAMKSNQTLNKIMSNFDFHSDCRGYAIRKFMLIYTTWRSGPRNFKAKHVAYFNLLWDFFKKFSAPINFAGSSWQKAIWNFSLKINLNTLLLRSLQSGWSSGETGACRHALGSRK